MNWDAHAGTVSKKAPQMRSSDMNLPNFRLYCSVVCHRTEVLSDSSEGDSNGSS